MTQTLPIFLFKLQFLQVHDVNKALYLVTHLRFGTKNLPGINAKPALKIKFTTLRKLSNYFFFLLGFT